MADRSKPNVNDGSGGRRSPHDASATSIASGHKVPSMHAPTGARKRTTTDGHREGGRTTAVPLMSVHSSPASYHRRESFMFRHDYGSDVSQNRSHASGIFDHDEAIVTPFAQLLNSLRNVHTNFIRLTNLPDSRIRRRSGAAAEKVKVMLTDEERLIMAHETLDELELCLDRLQNIQRLRSVGHMAAHKFRKMLDRELSNYAESSQSGQRVSDYITQTFLDKDGDNDAIPEEADSSETDMAARKDGRRNTGLSGVYRFIGPKAGASEKMRLTPSHHATANNIALDKFGVIPSDQDALVQHLKNVDKWGFELFKAAEASNNRPLTTVFYTIMQKRDLMNKLKIVPTELIAYMTRIEDHYRSGVPYHNRLHAADVVQSCHALFLIPSMQNVFTDLEIFSALLAGAIHDVDHPGLNNQFLVSSGSELALMHNDMSVLENHHLSVAFRLLQKNGCGVMNSFGRKKYQAARRMIIDIVLATDMCKHMEHLAHLRTRVEVRNLSNSGSNSDLSKQTLVGEAYNDRIQVMQSIIHLADLSNPAKPRELYTEWIQRVMEEFFRQGDKERQLGLEVSPMCDRNTVNIPAAQIGFMDYVVYPLFESWANFVHPDCQDLLDILDANRDFQQAELDRLSKQTATK